MSSRASVATEGLGEERREPVLEFRLAKGLDYRSRMRWTWGLAAGGLLLQVLFLSAWAGLPMLLAAVALSWVVGFDTAVDRRGYQPEAAWETAPTTRLREILDQDRKAGAWDSSALDVTSPGGALLFLLSCGALAAAFLGFVALRQPALGAIVAVDGGLLVLSQWFSGMRRVHRLPDLVLKARHLDAALAGIRGLLESRAELTCRLRMVGTKHERHPSDVQLAVRFPEAPEGFHGIQTQVVLNRVQGRPYPYGYSVVVARRGLGLLGAAEGWSPPAGLVLETKAERDVDVVVLRQATTKTSGYHTEPTVTASAMRAAWEVSERFLARAGS